MPLLNRKSYIITVYILCVTFLLSVLSYIYAPINYSNPFCNFCLFQFLISAFILNLYTSKKTLFTFEFFFTISFFFTNYVYGCFLYEILPNFSLFSLPFNHNYICKGTALTTMGYTAFSLGVFYKIQTFLISNKIKNLSFSVTNKIYLASIFLILIIPSLFKASQRDTYDTNLGSLVNLIEAFLIYIIYYIIFLQFSKHKKLKELATNTPKLFVIILCIYILLLLSIGTRTIPMRICLLILFLFSVNIKKITPTFSLVIMFLGATASFFIGVIRNGYNLSTMKSYFEIGNELIINNRSLFVLMDYADSHSYTLGKNFIMNILSIFPFLQSIFLKVTGYSLSEISSANLVTDLHFNTFSNDLTFGLGTNMIGDIYLAFGSIGVVICMFFLGYLINNLHYGISQNRIVALLVYSILFMDSIYYCRTSYLSPLRNIAWIYCIYKLDILTLKLAKRK